MMGSEFYRCPLCGGERDCYTSKCPCGRTSWNIPEETVIVRKIFWPDDFDGAHHVVPKGTPAPAGEPTSQ